MEDVKEYELIKNVYENNNYPSYDRLVKLVKQQDKTITRDLIKKWIESQTEIQLLRIQAKEKPAGHITVDYLNEVWNIDIFDFSKYYRDNNNYKYMFVAIDIFSRKVFIEPLTEKNSEACASALQVIIMENKVKPRLISSDDDGAFNSKPFNKILEINKIAHHTTIRGDHNALGIIDSFARKLRLIISRMFIRNKNTRWITNIKDIINKYNDTPHPALGKLTPNQATEEENHYIIYQINQAKKKITKTTSNLKVGDKVRKTTKNIFSKKSEPIWSDEVYEVVKVSGQRITLNNGTIYKRGSLLKVPNTTTSTEQNVITKTKK